MIHPTSIVETECSNIGKNTKIWAFTHICKNAIIGNDCIIHAGTVIGSDGFGFANTKDGKYIKIYQMYLYLFYMKVFLIHQLLH